MNYPYYNPYFPPQPSQNGFTQLRPEQVIQGYPQSQLMAQNAPQSQVQGFQTRPVTSREEAVAVQVDFLGPGTIMPDLGHGKIYLKKFNPNTGASDLFSFALEQADAPTDAVEYATKQDIAQVQQVVSGLASELEALRKPARGGKRLEADE